MVGLQHATHAKLAAYAGDAEAGERSTRAALDVLLVPREASRSPDGWSWLSIHKPRCLGTSVVFYSVICICYFSRNKKL